MHPDLILLDIDPDCAAGIEAIKHILKNHPGIRFIALSTYDEHATVEGVVRAGVRGF